VPTLIGLGNLVDILAEREPGRVLRLCAATHGAPGMVALQLDALASAGQHAR
jgi:hypothetical protein